MSKIGEAQNAEDQGNPERAQRQLRTVGCRRNDDEVGYQDKRVKYIRHDVTHPEMIV